MVAITATNRATPSTQASLGQAQLSQARRAAEQAESNARNLRAQADDAERQAQDRQQNVRTLAARTKQDDGTYSRPRAGNEKRTESDNAFKSEMRTTPVVNVQGQPTGQILNVSA